MNSKELKHLADTEENDLKAIGLYNKSFREGRNEKFREEVLPKLLKKYEVAESTQNKFVIDTLDLYGLVDYFPKANKVCIRNQQNKWITGGLTWIIENLL